MLVAVDQSSAAVLGRFANSFGADHLEQVGRQRLSAAIRIVRLQAREQESLRLVVQAWSCAQRIGNLVAHELETIAIREPERPHHLSYRWRILRRAWNAR